MYRYCTVIHLWVKVYVQLVYFTPPADLEVEVVCLDLWLREVEDGVGGPVSIHLARGWGRGQRGEWLSHYQVGELDSTHRENIISANCVNNWHSINFLKCD